MREIFLGYEKFDVNGRVIFAGWLHETLDSSIAFLYQWQVIHLDLIEYLDGKGIFHNSTHFHIETILGGPAPLSSHLLHLPN